MATTEPTLLFTDIEGSTRLWELHAEQMRIALECHDELLSRVITEHGGVVFKTVGDAFCAVFGDAASGVAAALVAQQRLAVAPWPDETPIRVRIALHRGPCIERDNDYFGPTVNRVARLLAVGHGGQTLLSRAVCDALGGPLPGDASLVDLGEHHLKDLGGSERVAQLVSADLRREFPPLRSLDNPAWRHNLPEQLTSFIGRSNELVTLREVLASERLVTITGAGGAGKTRLALQAAVEMLDGTGDGVWYVELAALRDADLVPSAVADVLHVRSEGGESTTAALVAALRDRDLLLIIDNCEHLLLPVAALAERLLQACPGVVILATSREPLGVGGEHALRIQSLATPDVDDRAAATVAESDAAMLFAERAAQHVPGFVIDDRNAEAVAEICARLDGLPLAIELAAARMRTLSLEEIRQGLAQRFRLLTGGSRAALPRQQTLRASIEWSYDQIEPLEQQMLQRLSVFAGGFEQPAAVAIGALGGHDEWDVRDALAALVDKSLAQRDETSGRHRLLETIRHFAQEAHVRGSEADVIETRRLHRDLFLLVAEQAATDIEGPAMAERLATLEREHANIRSAIDTCSEDPLGADAHFRLVVAMRLYWAVRGHAEEGLARVEIALRRAPEVSLDLRARAEWAAGYLAVNAARLDVARPHLDDALSLAAELEDPALRGRALLALCDVVRPLGHQEDAERFAREAAECARASGDDNLRAPALANLAFTQDDTATGVAFGEAACEAARRSANPRAMMVAGTNLGYLVLQIPDLEYAERLFAEVLAAARAIGERYGIANTLLNLASVNAERDEFLRMRTLVTEALEAADASHDHLLLMYGFAAMARAFVGIGRSDDAAVLYGHADMLAAERNLQFDHYEASARDADLERLAATLGLERAEALRSQGAALTNRQAVNLATG